MNKKQYNNLTDNEKKAIRLYKSWCKSDAPHEYKMAMVESCYKTLKILGIENFIMEDK